VVNLTAEAEEGYRFVNLTGDVDDGEDINAASMAITTNDNHSITTTFAFGTCFIATPDYGTPMAEEIEILREFRAAYLLTNPLGKGWVELCDQVGPPTAEFITEHPSLQLLVRTGLVPVVAMSAIAIDTTPAEKTALVGAFALILVALAI
jgi:hypothetical protein